MEPAIKQAVIIGGGIGGLTTAIALQKIGIEAVVYERAAALNMVGAGLTLWSNAIHALRRLGLAEPVIAAGSKIEKGAFRTDRGKTLVTVDQGELETQFGEPTIAIHRAELHRILLAALPAGTVKLNCVCQRVALDDGDAGVTFEDGSTTRADLLIGADGINSVVRRQLFPQISLRYSGYTAWRGVVTTTDPMILGSTSESWGPGQRFGIVPIAVHRVYWFATANTPAGVVQTADERQADLRRRFAGWHDPIPALIAATPAGEILRNDIFDIKPFQPWSQGRAVLLGDAAHPTTPNMGQGACMAIESAVVLAQALDQEPDLPAALARYERERQPRTAWITNTSWETGQIGQLANPAACAVRNFVVQITPVGVLKNRIARAAGYKV